MSTEQAKWPETLGDPVDPLENWQLYMEQSARTRNGHVPTWSEVKEGIERGMLARLFGGGK